MRGIKNSCSIDCFLSIKDQNGVNHISTKSFQIKKDKMEKEKKNITRNRQE